VTAAERLLIAVDRLNPPFVTADAWGAVQGFSIDLIRAVLAHSGLAVEFLPLDGPMAQIMWLAAGRVDAAADITVTERRRAWFAFSAYYHVEELMIFGRRDGPIWPGFRHFTGKLAVKANSYVQEYLIRHYPHIPLVAVESTEAELEALRAGRVQGFAATRETGLALIAAGDAQDVIAEGAPFGPAPLALATLPHQAERVLPPFNAGLKALRRSSELTRLQRQWLHAFAHA